ncbi:MAG: LysR substrate-binding domain-containing protein [Pseudomonadota bacterium]
MEDIKPIRVFLEVAEHLSFSRAAQSLKITAASVTRIVARLEQDLGQQLLVRTTRQVSLTSAGAVVAARMKPIVEDFDRTAREIAGAAQPDRGQLRINAPVSMGVRLLPGLADGFRLAYPNISLDFRLTDRLIDVIEEDCDLAIRVSKPPSDKSTIWRKVCRVPRHAIAAPSLFDRIPRPERPEEIDPATTLSYGEDGKGEIWEFHSGNQSRTIRADMQMTSNNGDFLYEMAKAGAGICVLPDFIVASGIARGEVIRVLPDWEVSNLWLTLYYPPYEQLPPLVATFTDYFERYMRDLDGLVFD